ncbi:MAG: hypothetical protein ACOC12_04670 [Bacteroidota bacterium]
MEAIMQKLIKISLVMNIVVLIPITTALLMDAHWVQKGYGDFTPARGILLSIYLAILVASILLFLKRNPNLVATLLFVQIVYKFTTPFTVGTIMNPVVISNLFIAAFHAVTLYYIWKSGSLNENRNPVNTLKKNPRFYRHS